MIGFPISTAGFSMKHGPKATPITQNATQYIYTAYTPWEALKGKVSGPGFACHLYVARNRTHMCTHACEHTIQIY